MELCAAHGGVGNEHESCVICRPEDGGGVMEEFGPRVECANCGGRMYSGVAHSCRTVEFSEWVPPGPDDPEPVEVEPKLPLGDAERKMLPIFTFLTQYFPDVIIELTQLCVAGNIQHNPELAPTDIKWAREKSTDQLNTAFRHAFDRGTGTHYDKDKQPHLIKAIWRLCAQRQLDIEAERKAKAAFVPRCGHVFAGQWQCIKRAGHEDGHFSPIANRMYPNAPRC